jgi:hypothetical protein
MSRRKNLKNESLSANRGKIILGLIIALMLTVPISLALATTSVPSPAQTDMFTAPHEVASPKTQFQVHIAYAYVGPAPSNVSTYFDQATNTTMRLVSQYPSSVRLNISCIPNAQIAGCDAVVEVYGIKIATDKGPAEYHAYFVGTNYNPSLSNASLSTLIQYVPDLYNVSLYSNLAGNFKFSWDSHTSFLTNTLGSITSYTAADSSALGLFSAGKPNAVSVTVYRIGYITITNGSVTVFEDPSNNTPTDMVQLSNYESGFLHNDLMPSAQLPQENLFQPIAHP